MNKPFLASAIVSFSLLAGCSAPNTLPAKKETSPNTSKQNICLNEFKALQHLSKSDYEVYQQQFNQLNKTYDVYKNNKEVINKDSKEILNIELNAKLTLICARVKNAVFINMDKRSQEINNI